MHMEEPIVFSALTPQPVLSDCINLVCGLKTKLANVISLIKARIPMKGGVALGE
jgi:hypothetical protein